MMKSGLFFFPFLFIFTSCGLSSGYAQNHGGTNVNYQMSVNDMKFEGEISAKVKGASAFCIIPAYKELYNKAMKQLNEQAGLKKGSKAILNVRVDVEDYFYFLFCSKHVTVSGDLYTIIKDKPEAEPSLEEQTVISVGNTKKAEPVKSKFYEPEERKSFLAPLWDALKNKETSKIKDQVFESMTDTPAVLKQEGFYFLGDVALIEGDLEKAELYYRKGVDEVSRQFQKPDFSGLKFHLQQVSILFPDNKEVIQNIFNNLTK